MKDEKFVKYWLDVRSEGKKSFVIKSTFFNSFAILLGLSVYRIAIPLLINGYIEDIYFEFILLLISGFLIFATSYTYNLSQWKKGEVRYSNLINKK